MATQKNKKENLISAFANKLIGAVLILMLISAIYSMITESIDKPEEITLTQLATEISGGNVKEVKVDGSDLEIKFKDDVVKNSRKEDSVGLTETLSAYGVNQEQLKNVAISVNKPSEAGFWIGVVSSILFPILLLVFFFWFMSKQVKGANLQAFSFGQSRARVSMGEKGRITFKDVAGVKEAKEELQEIVEFLKSPKKFIDMGAKIPKGVLLMGAPGTGKTLMARAVAGEANVPFFHLSGSEFVEMFVGVGASRVRDLFKNAKKAAPAIVFIDEIDAVGRQRGTGLGGGHDEREQTLNQILVEMDGFEPNEKVIVIAATNRPDVLDPALLRPGRFDRRVILDLPDLDDREEILKIHAEGKPLDKETKLRVIAERTPGFSGADLQNLMNESAIMAARENRKTIQQLDMIKSIEKVMLGSERKSHLLSKEEKAIASYHEAGHALVASVLINSDPVHKVSVVSRGRAAGYTLKLPIEERHLYTKSHFVDELAVSLGGYAAEKMVFGDITTGASDDISRATDVARALVTKYGMSDKIGPVAFSEKSDMVFLGRDFGHEKNYSEDVAKEIDEEVRQFMYSAYKKAEETIKQHKKLLDAIAKELIEKETVERDEFDHLLKDHGIKPKKELHDELMEAAK